MSKEEPAANMYLTVEQVADELNVGIPQVRSLLKSGELRGFQIGGRGYLARLLPLMRIVT